MIKNKNKALALVIASVLGISLLVSCAPAIKAPEVASEATPEATAPESPVAQEVVPEQNTEIVYKIGIIQSVEHVALDSSREGFIAALKEKGVNVEYDYQNAQGEQATLKTIASSFVAKKSDLVFAIATDSAQTMVGATTDIPVLFTAVTDPLSAGIVVNMDAPGANVSGTSDMNPIDKQMEFIKQLYPEIKTLGIIYTSSELNSEIQANIAAEYCKTIGIETIILTSSSVTDISTVVESLAAKSDAIYIPTDNQIASAMASVAKVSEKLKFPIFAAEPGMTHEGGLATIGINYYNLGYQTGLMAYKVLVEKTPVGSLKVETLDKADYYLNERTANAIGFVFSQELKDSAAEIWID